MAPLEPTLTDDAHPLTGTPSSFGSTVTYHASYGPSTVTVASSTSMPVARSTSSAISRASSSDGRSAGGSRSIGVGSGTGQSASGGQGSSVLTHSSTVEPSFASYVVQLPPAVASRGAMVVTGASGATAASGGTAPASPATPQSTAGPGSQPGVPPPSPSAGWISYCWIENHQLPPPPS